MTTAKKIDINGLQLDKPDNTQSLLLTPNDGLEIRYDLLTANPKTFKINSGGVNFVDNTNNFTTELSRLSAVQLAFSAVELPPNPTTLKLNDTLLLDNGTINTTYNVGNIDATNSGLNIIAPSSNVYIGDVNGTSNQTKLSVNDNQYNLDLKAVNLTTQLNQFTLPISFTSRRQDSASYSFTNSWVNVYSYTIGFPLFAQDINSTYNFWAINFSVNLRSFDNQNDKAFAMYFEFQDVNSNTYVPELFNLVKPFTRHSNQSTYNNTNTDMMNYTWSDFVDFSNLIFNQGNIDFRWWMYGDLTHNLDFYILLTFTRTNLI